MKVTKLFLGVWAAVTASSVTAVDVASDGPDATAHTVPKDLHLRASVVAEAAIKTAAVSGQDDSIATQVFETFAAMEAEDSSDVANFTTNVEEEALDITHTHTLKDSVDQVVVIDSNTPNVQDKALEDDVGTDARKGDAGTHEIPEIIHESLKTILDHEVLPDYILDALKDLDDHHEVRVKSLAQDSTAVAGDDFGRSGSSCIYDYLTRGGDNIWYECPKSHPICNGYQPGRSGTCEAEFGDFDSNYKKDYFTIGITHSGKDMFLSASNWPENSKRSKVARFVTYDQSTEEGRKLLAEDYFAHWRFDHAKDLIGNGGSCEQVACHIVINRGKGMPLAVHKGRLIGASGSDQNINDDVGVLVTTMDGSKGDLSDLGNHYDHTVFIHKRTYPETKWRLSPNLKSLSAGTTKYISVSSKSCIYPSWRWGKGGGTYKCPSNQVCLGYHAHNQWGNCVDYGGSANLNWDASRGGFQLTKHVGDEEDCDPFVNDDKHCYMYLKVTSDRNQFQHVTINSVTSDPPRDINDMGAASYDTIAALSDTSRDFFMMATEGGAAAMEMAGYAVNPGVAFAFSIFMDMAWGDDSEEKALQKLAKQILNLAYEQATSEIAQNNVQNGNDALSLSRVGFLVAYKTMKDKYVKNGDENSSYFLDDLQLLVVKLESIIDTHNQGINIYLSDSDYDMYNTVTVKTAQTGFKTLKLSYMELISMVQELTALHSYIRVKRGETFDCGELANFVKTLCLFEHTNSVLTDQKAMLVNRRNAIKAGQSPWHDERLDSHSSGGQAYSMDRFFQDESKGFKRFYKTSDSNSYYQRSKATYLYSIELGTEMGRMKHYDIEKELQALDLGRSSLEPICEKVKTNPDWFKAG